MSELKKNTPQISVRYEIFEYITWLHKQRFASSLLFSAHLANLFSFQLGKDTQSFVKKKLYFKFSLTDTGTFL